MSEYPLQERSGACGRVLSYPLFLLGQQQVTAHHTPGHTAGSVTFQAGTMLFTGDTLAVGSPGTPGPEPGSLELLWQSTQALAALGGQFVVHPGHSADTEVSMEDNGLRHGVFSHFLIKGLKGEADQNADKMVQLGELFHFVTNEVKRYTRNRQSPHTAGRFDQSMPVAFIR